MLYVFDYFKKIICNFFFFILIFNNSIYKEIFVLLKLVINKFIYFHHEYANEH